MKRLVVVFAVAACGDDTGGFPIDPGGGGSGSSFTPDAAVVDPDGGTMLTGRVCLLADPRQPQTCATTGAGGFTVAVGGQVATTGDTGSFTLLRPTGSDLVWTVTGDTIEPSAMRFGTSTTIPAISTLVYDDMLAAMQAVVNGGNGAIVAQFIQDGDPVANATALVTPIPDSETYYDGAAVTDWDFTATGPFGVVWVSSLQPGTASLALDHGAADPHTVSNIPVLADTITFVFSEIP